MPGLQELIARSRGLENRLRAYGILILLFTTACVFGAVGTTPRSDESREDIGIQEIDAWYAMVAAMPCIRAQLDLVVTGARERTHTSTHADREFVRVAYTRVARRNLVILRDVQLVHSASSSPWLDQCLVAAVEGLRFRDPRNGTAVAEEHETRSHELAFSNALLGELARELHANE